MEEMLLCLMLLDVRLPPAARGRNAAHILVKDFILVPYLLKCHFNQEMNGFARLSASLLWTCIMSGS